MSDSIFFAFLLKFGFIAVAGKAAQEWIMKKTEKIEVRVSLEEKERLGKMAEKRGQSVSDMIRERMSEDCLLYTSPSPRDS